MPDAAARETYPTRRNIVSLAIVAGHVIFVLAPIYLAASFRPTPILVLFWLWFGLSMHGLLNMMHECAHYHAFRGRRGSDLLGRWVLAPLMFADFDQYRLLHWAHHRDLGGHDDPKYSYSVDIRGYRLARFLLTCLIGAEAVRKFFYQQRSVKKSSSPLWILRVLVFQSVFVVSLVGTAYWWAGEDLRTALVHGATAYACVYAYGLMSLALFVATLRSIAEHQAGPDDPIVAGRAALRNLKCGALARLIFGCYGFAEHATHHWQPALPYYHLRAATIDLALNDAHFAPRLGYVSILMAQVALTQPPPRLALR